MSDSRTNRYEYSLYITNECHHITLEIKGTNIFKSQNTLGFFLSAIKHSNLKRDFTSVYLRLTRIILLKADDIIKTSFILINSYMKYM
jgi:hypothetical protein